MGLFCGLSTWISCDSSWNFKRSKGFYYYTIPYFGISWHAWQGKEWKIEIHQDKMSSFIAWRSLQFLCPIWSIGLSNIFVCIGLRMSRRNTWQNFDARMVGRPTFCDLSVVGKILKGLICIVPRAAWVPSTEIGVYVM